MVTRISTSGVYGSVLANLLSAEARQNEAGAQVATQKKGKDLKAFANSAELLTSMRTVHSRLKVYQDQNGVIADKLATQDAALGQVAQAAQAARQAIADALASGHADGLVEGMQAQMRNAMDGLNAKYGGKYLFGGGQVDSQPALAQSLTDLTAGGPPGPAVGTLFQNDTYVAKAKLSDSTTVQTGLLASDLGSDMLTAFQAFQFFQESGAGPFTGTLTAAQKTFLQSQLDDWDAVHADLTSATAQNGLVQKQVDDVADDLLTRQNSLTGMMGDITDADMPMAITQLQMAQTAVQAAAQVFQSLQSSSLLNILK